MDMSRSPNRAGGAYAATGLAVLSGMALWPGLPAELASHTVATSTPDGLRDEAVGLVLAPTIGSTVRSNVYVAGYGTRTL